MFYSSRPMATLSPDVTAAVASLQARWGAAAPRTAGNPITDGALALAPATAPPDGPELVPTRSRPIVPSRSRRRRPGHPHRVRGARRHPGAGRPAAKRERRHPRRRLERPDHARPPPRRRGTERRLDRGLARPVAQLRPGRGGRPWCPPRMARGHHPGDARRGPRHRWRAAGRALGRPARPRPARWPAGGHGSSRPASPTGSAGWRRSPDARRRSSSCSNRPVTRVA